MGLLRWKSGRVRRNCHRKGTRRDAAMFRVARRRRDDCPPMLHANTERKIQNQLHRHQTKNANRKMKLSIGALSLALTWSSSTAAAAAAERELQLPPSVMCLGGGGSIESCCADADASDALCSALICTDFDTISIKDGCQCSSLGNLCANAVLTGVLNTVAPGEV